MAEKRLRYYNGQFLQEQDFTAEQEYHLDRQRRHNRQLHTYGIAEGLTVNAGEGATSAVVSPGTAIDGEGRTIVLTESRNVPFNGLTGAVLVVISYAQQTSDPATVGDEGNTRWWERPDLEVIAEAGAPAADVRIRLARLQIAGNNTVSSHDTSVRNSAGVKLGTEVSIERIRLSRQGVDQAQWPVLTSGAAGRADLAGNLSVTGNITVTGTVDGRDISVEGSRIDNLFASTIQNVSNVGGNISLVGQNGITIVGNDAANTITFGVGAPASIDGVSNPGANIDLVAGGAITITPDNTVNKRITISETHSAATGNPHGTTAAQLNQYDLRSRYTSNSQFRVNFTDNDGNGATRTITTGFQPRLIWANGFAQGYLYDYLYGGVTNGVARVEDGNIYQNCSGPSVWRYSGGPGIIQWAHLDYSSVASGEFWDWYSSTWINYHLTIRVSSTTANSVTFMLQRPATVSDFNIEVNFTCFGY